MITVLIADDEKHGRERLKKLLSEFKELTLVGEAANGDEALQQIILQKPDAAFLDIQMPGTSVFNTLSSIKDPPLIVFQTAHADYAVDAFGINAVDYILKPVRKERLAQAIEKVTKALQSTKTQTGAPGETQEQEKKEEIKEGPLSISVKLGGTITIVPVEEIFRISFEDGFCYVYTDEKRFFSDKPLVYYEEKLESRGFYRVNRNDLINTHFIQTIHKMFHGNYIIELSNKNKVKLARRRVGTLKKIVDF